MERSRDIEQLVRAWFAAASKGDPALVRAHVSGSDATSLIGSDPSEIFKGGAAVTEFLMGEVSSAAGHAHFAPRNTAAFSEGSLGWATTDLTITLPDGKYVTPRWSAVLHREDAAWKFVQIHASIGIGNDAVGWVYPTDPTAPTDRT